MSGGVTLVAGPIGNAYYFDGAYGSYVQVTNQANLGGMSNLTLSAWVNVPSWSGSGQMQDLIRDWDVNTCYILSADNYNNLRGAISGYGTCGFPRDSVPSTGWHLVTFTEAAGAWGIYLDGVLTSTTTTSALTVPSAASNASLLIGGNTSVSQSEGWTGGIDDVGVWNQGMSAPQAMAMCKAPTTFTTDAAAGFYGQMDMQSLFNLYAPGSHTPVSINGKTWAYSANLATSLPGITLPGIPTGAIGSAVDNVGNFNGSYFIQFDGSGGGVYVAIPEPGTLALLAAGLAGLLCYAWRKRR